MNSRNYIVGLVLGAALAAGIFVATRVGAPTEPRSAFVFPAPMELPQFSLVDQYGNPVSAETFQGQWDLVFFGFANCPDICPATLQILAASKRQLAADGMQPLPRIVLVSVDPERDTPEVLREYVDYFGAGNLGVTGALQEISKLTSALGIYFEKQAAAADNYGVDHSAVVLVFNPAGQSHALFSTPHVIDDFVHDLKIVMASR